jgi:hypothetical protein
VTQTGLSCDPCASEAQRFCAVGALIVAAYDLTGDHERAHRLGWQVAGMIAEAAQLHRADDGEAGWRLTRLNDSRGQAAVLRAFDTLIGQRRA